MSSRSDSMMKTDTPTIGGIDHSHPPNGAERPRLTIAGTSARLALIGAVLAAVIATFAYLGGWLTPNELTPARFTDTFERVDGVHPGFRRNHAKGLGVSGYFESNGNGARSLESRAFPSRTKSARDRPILLGGRPAFRRRQVRYPARHGPPIFAARW